MPEEWRLRPDRVVLCVEELDKALDIQVHVMLGMDLTSSAERSFIHSSVTPGCRWFPDSSPGGGGQVLRAADPQPRVKWRLGSDILGVVYGVPFLFPTGGGVTPQNQTLSPGEVWPCLGLFTAISSLRIRLIAKTCPAAHGLSRPRRA